MEVKEIISLVSEEFNDDCAAGQSGKRLALCYIIRKDGHPIEDIVKALGETPSSIDAYCSVANILIADDQEFAAEINRIETMIAEANADTGAKLFHFSPKEERRMKKAIEASKEFMSTFGKGQSPHYRRLPSFLPS